MLIYILFGFSFIMGTQNTKGLSRQVEARKINQKQTNYQFQPCCQRWQANKNFLSTCVTKIDQLFNQTPLLINNLTKFFPNSQINYDEFTEMAEFLQKLEVRPEKSQFAIYNFRKTNLIDRFFMVVLDISKWEDYEKLLMNSQKLQTTFLQFMKLFIPNPKSGFIEKLRKLLRLQSPDQILLKDFAYAIRKNLPQVNRHMRQYFTKKFRDLKKQFFLLNNFKSTILQEDAVILSLQLPQLTGSEIKLLYDSDSCGLSFHSYERRIIGYDGPWLLLVESSDKEVYKFGSFQTGPIRDIVGYQGDLRGFMFSIEPNIRFMTTDKGENANHYYFINTIDQKISKKRKGIGFGGDFGKNNCKLWIDQDLDKSTVFNGNDPTYGYGNLANPMSTSLTIRKMQIWGLGNKFDLQKQATYWQQRQEEIMKRRKVNKKQLIDGNAGLIFENTFAHRDQVRGEIEKAPKKEQN